MVGEKGCERAGVGWEERLTDRVQWCRAVLGYVASEEFGEHTSIKVQGLKMWEGEAAGVVLIMIPILFIL